MESEKKAHSHEISIALIQKDITYIRESMARMEGTMSTHDSLYAKKEELTSVAKDMEQAHKDMRALIEQKVNLSDFQPIQKTLSRINWMVIAAIISALLGLVVKITI